jgi:hypothetical protein
MACQLGGVSSVDSVDITVYADGDLTAIVLGLSHLLSPLSEQLAELLTRNRSLVGSGLRLVPDERRSLLPAPVALVPHSNLGLR